MPEELPAAIQRFIDATNAADTEGFLDAFTPEASLNDWGREFSGREGIAGWNQTDNIGVQARLSVVSFRAEGPDAYRVTLTVSGNSYNGTGPMLFTLNNGLIARLVISG